MRTEEVIINLKYEKEDLSMKIEQQPFGMEGATLYTLINDSGIKLQATNLGARIVSLKLPIRNQLRNIVLGFPTATDYLKNSDYSYIGASIGRVAGRIASGKATINSVDYNFPQNNNDNTLHGGTDSFETKLWQTDIREQENCTQLIFTYHSPNGENGFPGNLTSVVTYTLTQDNEWCIDFKATTDQDTLYNPTNHVYFNLLGEPDKSVSDHLLHLKASRFAVIDSNCLPTGELREVKDTPFDFTSILGSNLEKGFTSNYEQNIIVDGYDHPFVFNNCDINEMQGFLQSPNQDVTIKIYTDAPAVVVYTMNIGEKSIPTGNKWIGNHGGITLETQILPDAIHHEGFGDIILKSKNEFQSKTIFKIEWEQ